LNRAWNRCHAADDTNGKAMSMIWRFYVDEQRQWRWQHLTVGSNVFCESSSGFSDHDACVVSATQHGYVHAPTQQALYAEKLRRRLR